MSNIKTFNLKGNTTTLKLYIGTLEHYISEVLKCVGESDDGIVWKICKEEDIAGEKEYFGVLTHREYGKTTFNRKEGIIEIYISVETIMGASGICEFKRKKLSERTYQEQLLIGVILDELAHAKTRCDHGSQEYDDKLKAYYKCFS